MIIPIYLYLDDSKQLHERFGNKIASFLYEGSSNDILIRYFRYQDIFVMIGISNEITKGKSILERLVKKI